MKKKRLKELRERKGLTLEQLAEQSGVSKRTIQNYESKEYTHSPNADTLRAICRILCPEDPQKAWDEVMDFQDNGYKNTESGDKDDAACNSEDSIREDYSYEKSLLERRADKIPAGLNGALRVLLDPESTDSVMGAIAGMCGYLRISSGNPAVCGATFEFLSSLAAVIQKAVLTENPEQLERFTRAIIADISELVSNGDVPDPVAINLKTVVGDLMKSRGSNCLEERLTASKATFFSLYDSWNHINRIPLSYTILSHFTMLFDETEDTPELRRRVFYAVINHFEEVEVAKRAISCANVKSKIVCGSPGQES